MVSFRRYLETRKDTESLRDVLTVLGSGRNISLTVDDVLAHLPAGTKRDTVDDKIKRAVKKGFAIEVEPSSYTKGRGRPDKRYQLDKSLWEGYQRSENTPEKIDILYASCMSVRLETEEDRKRLDDAGIVHCPSCGNPVPKSDILRVLGDDIDSCLTEYVHDAFLCSKPEEDLSGFYKETVEGLQGVIATGITVDECRLNLIEAIRVWIIKRQREGLSIPVLGNRPKKFEMRALR